MALTIVETRAVTGGVDTHADVHVAAALDPIGGRPQAGRSVVGSRGASSAAWELTSLLAFPAFSRSSLR